MSTWNRGWVEDGRTEDGTAKAIENAMISFACIEHREKRLA